MVPLNSKIRLDPIEGVFSMRGYPVAGDPSVRLADEGREYCAVATITISGHVAVATLTKGDLLDLALWPDIDAALRKKGVTELHWERHKNGKVLPKKRRIR